MIPFLGRTIDKRILGDSFALKFKPQELQHLKFTMSRFLAFLNEGGKKPVQFVCPLLLKKSAEWKDRPKLLRLQDQSQKIRMIYRLRVDGLSLDYNQNDFLHNYNIKTNKHSWKFQKRIKLDRQQSQTKTMLSQIVQQKKQEQKTAIKSLLQEKIKKESLSKSTLLGAIKSRILKTESFLNVDSILFESIQIAASNERKVFEVVTRWAEERGDGVPSQRHLIDFGFWRNGLPPLQVYKFVQ